MGALEEKFKVSFRGTIRSSLGYTVRGSTRWTVTYQDSMSRTEIPAEMLNLRPYGYAVRVADVPTDLTTSRDEIVDRLRRAFTAAGAVLQVEES